VIVLTPAYQRDQPGQSYISFLKLVMLLTQPFS
jgi:hypothetical protein